MDGYYGCGIDLLPVPHDPEPSDRLPSPNSWSSWGVLRPGAWGEGNVISDDGGAFVARLGGVLQDEYQPRYEHSDPAAEESVHEFFYGNSSLNDLQSAENVQQHGPLCFCSRCDCEVIPADDSWFDIISSPGLPRNAEMSVELEEQSMLSSRDLDDCGGETPTIPLNTKAYQPLQDSPSYNGKIIPSGQFEQHYLEVSDSSPEEVALEELKMVMTLLPDQTRICLRDALYRLADNSKHRPLRADSQERGSGIRKPPLTVANKRSSSSEGTNETKTNVIDRAIASIMFNRMDSRLQEDQYSASAETGSNLLNSHACGELQCSSDGNLQAVCWEGRVNKKCMGYIW